MGCPDDYTVQAIMRWGYPKPPNPIAEALLDDIGDLENEIERKKRKLDLLAEEIEALEEELRDKQEHFDDI